MPKKKSEQEKQKKQHEEEILLGIDYGTTNIGLAFGRVGLVSPVGVVSGKNNDVAIKEIAEFVLQNKITKIIIGVPKRFDGGDTPMSRQIQRFGKMLRILLKKPVEYIDESYTSLESAEISISEHLPQKSRKSVDAVSAALILKNYFASKD